MQSFAVLAFINGTKKNQDNFSSVHNVDNVDKVENVDKLDKVDKLDNVDNVDSRLIATRGLEGQDSLNLDNFAP